MALLVLGNLHRDILPEETRLRTVVRRFAYINRAIWVLPGQLVKTAFKGAEAQVRPVVTTLQGTAVGVPIDTTRLVTQSPQLLPQALRPA